MEIQKFYGDYLIGTESQLQQFCSRFNIGYTSQSKRLSTDNQRILIEFADLLPRQVAEARSLGIAILRQGQACQLGIGNYQDIKNERGEYSLFTLFSWLYSFCLTDVVYSEGTPEPAVEQLTTLNTELGHWFVENV
jgi:hypothetical protein